eukprot:15447915-Alexandrium_andersonii.AAC.1
MQLPAAPGGFVQLRAPLGALSRWPRAPEGAQSHTKPPEAAESCMLQLSATLGCAKSFGQLGGAN